MLERIVKHRQKEIARLSEERRRNGPPSVHDGPRPPFAEALLRSGPGAVIAEFKPASPLSGSFETDLSPAERAKAYAAGGAAAISVLTEEEHFRSSPAELWTMQQAGLPMLRKDFLIDPVQIEQTAATPASALLLIARLFMDRPAQLAELAGLSSGYGLEPVIEIFNPAELRLARQAGARIIQVNNRDLSTMRLDLQRSRDLIAERRPGEVWICASGLDRADQVLEMASLGYAACLIGTSLMRSPDPARLIMDLTGRRDGV